MKLNALQERYLRVLRNYGYSRAVRKVTDRQVFDSIKTKKHLIELFRNHPEWREDELRIVTRAKHERRFEYAAIQKFTSFLEEAVKKDREESGEETYLLRMEVVSFINKIHHQFFAENVDYYRPLLDKLNKACDGFRLRDNMKTGKAIMKMCVETGMDKFDGFNKAYSELSDNINPKSDDVFCVWSVAPEDFLLMSNGENWKSCHLLGDDESCHMAGSIGYMLDTDSFLYFEIRPDDLGDITNAYKVVRQVFGYNDFILMQSRLYPQANDSGAEKAYHDIRTRTQQMIATCLGKESNWLTSQKYASEVPYQNCDAAYPDWETYNPGSSMCHVSVHKERPDGTKNIAGSIFMGAYPTSVVTGEDLVDWDDVA